MKPHYHKLDSYLLFLGEDRASGSGVEFGFLDLGTVSQPCTMDILSCNHFVMGAAMCFMGCSAASLTFSWLL